MKKTLVAGTLALTFVAGAEIRAKKPETRESDLKEQRDESESRARTAMMTQLAAVVDAHAKEGKAGIFQIVRDGDHFAVLPLEPLLKASASKPDNHPQPSDPQPSAR